MYSSQSEEEFIDNPEYGITNSFRITTFYCSNVVPSVCILPVFTTYINLDIIPLFILYLPTYFYLAK